MNFNEKDSIQVENKKLKKFFLFLYLYKNFNVSYADTLKINSTMATHYLENLSQYQPIASWHLRGDLSLFQNTLQFPLQKYLIV
jgi:hypothetical protein